VRFSERRNVKLSYLPENVVGIDTRGQYVVMDKGSENFEELSYCLTLLDDCKCEKIRKEVESAPHPSMLVEGTSCIDQYSGRDVVARRSSGRIVWEDWLIGGVGYFRMEVVDKAARDGHGSSRAGTSVGWNVFEFEGFVVWHDEDLVSQT
jgi:hypothetical protein